MPCGTCQAGYVLKAVKKIRQTYEIKNLPEKTYKKNLSGIGQDLTPFLTGKSSICILYRHEKIDMVY